MVFVRKLCVVNALMRYFSKFSLFYIIGEKDKKNRIIFKTFNKFFFVDFYVISKEIYVEILNFYPILLSILFRHDMISKSQLLLIHIE